MAAAPAAGSAQVEGSGTTARLPVDSLKTRVCDVNDADVPVQTAPPSPVRTIEAESPPQVAVNRCRSG